MKYLYIKLLLFQMPKSVLNHDACLRLVCAVCTNLHGKKASRGVSEVEAIKIRKFVFAEYKRESKFFPQGLCTICQRKLCRLDEKTNIPMEQDITPLVATEDREERASQADNLLLPEDYHCVIPPITRSQANTPCSCRWCKIARLNGPKFLCWQREILKKRENEPVITRMCHSCGKGVPVLQITHNCNSSDQDIVKNMVESIPESIKAKLVHSLVKEMELEKKEAHGSQNSPHDSKVILLPPATGGKPLPIFVGAQPSSSKFEPLTHQEAVQMSSRHNLSGKQQDGILSDLRVKWGRQVVDPMLKEAMPAHNQQFAPFYTVEEKNWLNSNNQVLKKNLFYCHNIVGLISEVDGVRKNSYADMENLIQGDTGQDWLKIGLNRINKADLEKKPGIRIQAAGVHFANFENEEEELKGRGKKRLKRRTRGEGISGGPQLKDWGARKMILLAIVHKIPENHHNLSIIFEAIKLENIPFKLTGDFAFLMPILGLVKGCGGSNPCPLCNQRKTTQGGAGSHWVGEEEAEISLRTLGSLYSNYAGWVADGEKYSAEGTRKWDSVCGSPLLTLTAGRKYTDYLLDLIVPGPLHLFLSLNEIINFLEKTLWPEVKNVLKNVIGVEFHVYMGKVGNYEGPSLNKLLRNLDMLEPYMLGGSTMRLFFVTFKAFSDVAKAVFTQGMLENDWREKLHHLRSCILQLHSQFGMSITPKLHILITHVEQWVDVFGRSLGKEGEQQGEAVHHIWKQLLQTIGEPKVKESPAFIRVILKALLIFNANNL